MFDTAVVTGASRGLGFAIARRLAEIGHGTSARVILTARSGRDAQSAATALHAEGFSCVEPYSASLDVADARSVAAFGRFAADELDGFDLLVNNAAICEPGWDPRVVRSTLRTNVLGPLALTRLALGDMLHRRRGHIVHISSGDGELVYLNPALQEELHAATSEGAVLRTLVRAAPPRDAFGASPAHSLTPAYALSKAALNALTRIAAADLPPPHVCGVRISAVCPGDVLTRMCTEAEARQHAVAPSMAAFDVTWLAIAGLDVSPEQRGSSRSSLPSGRFWRSRQMIDF